MKKSPLNLSKKMGRFSKWVQYTIKRILPEPKIPFPVSGVFTTHSTQQYLKQPFEKCNLDRTHAVCLDHRTNQYHRNHS